MDASTQKLSKVSLVLSIVSLVLMVSLLVFGSSNISWASLNLLRSQQRLQLSRLGLASIARDNLASAAVSLRLSIPSQKRDFPIDELTRLPAWSQLEVKLGAYTERLKLVET